MLFEAFKRNRAELADKASFLIAAGDRSVPIAWRQFARVFAPVGGAVQLIVERVLPKREAKPKMTPESVLKILKDRKDGVKLSDFESALIRRIMQLRAKGEFVVPETLLPALDDKTL